MSNIREALIHSSVAQYSVTAIGLLSTILIARLLTPSEIGIYAIASAFVMMLNEFRIMGASEYLIREKYTTEETVKSALGLSIGISWGFALALFSGSKYFAEFYETPELQNIIYLLLPGFILAPYSSICFALFSKNFDFYIQLKIKILSNFLMFAVTIGSILLGFSFYSLALGQLVKEATVFGIAIINKPAEMRVIPSFKGVSKIAYFGLNNSGANLLRKGITIAPDLIIGKLGTVAQVAMFSRGLGLVNFLIDTPKMGIAPVVLPYLAKNYHQTNSVSEAYIKSSILLGGLVGPVLGVASLVSLPMIRFMFGDQWDAAAPIASILCFWGIFKTAHWFSNNALAAVKAEGILIIKELLPLIALVTGIILFYKNDLVTIAWVFLIVGAIEFIFVSFLVYFYANVDINRYLLEWARIAVITIFSMAVCMAVGTFIPFQASPSWLVMVVLAIIMPVSWIVLLKLFKHPLYDEILLNFKKLRS
jgi:O-antigen/teichoic acid export membrane protein